MSKPGFVATVRSLPRTFWVANTMEIFERMAWYGFYALSSLYITGKVQDGCLGFTSEQRGLLQGVVPFFLYLFPVVTGALGDRFGYKKMFFLAYAILAPGYYLLGQFTSFGGFFAVFMFVAVGAAVFKPVVVGTVARTTDERSGSLGFGIFYMMVNIGGFLGPVFAGMVRSDPRLGWEWVFILSAIWISVNFVWLLLFYREPTTEAASATPRSLRKVMSDVVEVLGNGRFFLTVAVVLVLLVIGSRFLPWTVTVVFSAAWVACNVVWDLVLRGLGTEGRVWVVQRMRLGDWRFSVFLLILAGFWTMFNQIFITMPEYIRDFTDTTPILAWLRDVFAAVGLDGMSEKMAALIRERWQINPEYLINLNAGAIVMFQLLVSWGMARFHAFTTMVLGVIVAAAGIATAALGGGGVGITAWIAVAAILVFAFGEMAASPKSQEYIGRIAPPDKVAMYMGYYFVAMALGNLFGGLLSGEAYGTLARDMRRPDLMWLLFAGLGLVTVVALVAYNRWAHPPRGDEAKAQA